MPMKRHDDSQRSGRLAMAFADLADLRVVDRVVASHSKLASPGVRRIDDEAP